MTQEPHNMGAYASKQLEKLKEQTEKLDHTQDNSKEIKKINQGLEKLKATGKCDEKKIEALQIQLEKLEKVVQPDEVAANKKEADKTVVQQAKEKLEEMIPQPAEDDVNRDGL